MAGEWNGSLVCSSVARRLVYLYFEAMHFRVGVMDHVTFPS